MVFFTSRAAPSNKTYDPVFANNDWAAIIEACHANEVPDTWVADAPAIRIWTSAARRTVSTSSERTTMICQTGRAKRR